MSSMTQESPKVPENKRGALGPGNFLSTGMVLETKEREYRSGEMPGMHGIAICLLLHNPYHPFAVWRYVNPIDDRPYAMHGTYCETLSEAMKDYESREP